MRVILKKNTYIRRDTASTQANNGLPKKVVQIKPSGVAACCCVAMRVCLSVAAVVASTTSMQYQYAVALLLQALVYVWH